MPFEDFDKKIREAADKHHPAYDEKAWLKMEKLLNEHLPRPKKDKRRLLFFLLLFLLVGGGMWTVVATLGDRNSKPENDLVRRVEKTPDQSAQSKAPVSPLTNTQPERKSEQSPVELPLSQAGAAGNNISGTKNNNLTASDGIPHFAGKRQGVPAVNQESQVTSDKPANMQTADERKENTTLPKTDVSNAERNDQVDRSDIGDTKLKREPMKEPETAQEQQEDKVKADSQKPAPKPTTRVSKMNGLSFSLSAGPDISSVGSEIGKMRLAYGLGIGYTRQRFTLRTGIYAARKVYTAEAKYYKLGYTAPPNYIFESADANCYVLEIPLKIDYSFAVNNRSNWFVSGGLSSYIMKEEKYVYNFKTTWGYYPRNHDVSNKNKHYFSVLDLSAGYTRRLNDFLFVSAEPYVGIPLRGIGEGKVNLKSAGVLFSIGVKPFQKH